MSEHRDLLFEIGTEELPPRALRSLSRALGEGLSQAFRELGLDFEAHRVFATPRRLSVIVSALSTRQPDRPGERKGPSVKAAFDGEGNPTRAAEGFARSCGVAVADLERLETDKGAWLVHRSTQAGAPATSLIPDAVRKALDDLPIPKRMRWGSSDEEFVRPVHWVVLLFGEEIVDAEILGVRTDRFTRGHRFHHPAPIALVGAGDYVSTLRGTGRVEPDYNARETRIREQAESLAADLGGQALIDDDLLDEIAALVELPIALSGNFDARFLQVPHETLVTTMQGNQKYIPVVDREGRLMPHFIAVSNIDSREMVRVREGNERVIRPRFEDAEFFWNQDRKTPLSSRREALGNVVFQKQLGTLLDKSERLTKLCASIASAVGSDPDNARRAAELCKCDLMTDMVVEFPSLQGIMGRYYAGHDGESDEVAIALDEQYLPRKAGDALPETGTGRVLALADRLDTLVGIFAAGLRPTGLKDPFGLRRAALGTLRIIIEGGLPLDLLDLLRQAAREFPQAMAADEAAEAVFEYALDRLRAYYLDRGIASDVIDAVHARRPTCPQEFDSRVRAVEAFRRLPEADSLTAANKRIRNILRQAGESVEGSVDEALLDQGAETHLFRSLNDITHSVDPLFAKGLYREALTMLATLRAPIDAFFDEVMVMAEDPGLRNNRLALLHRLSEQFLRAADLSRLQGASQHAAKP
ncbi:MAG: glycine--tRNA ligase subunit beta [Pseudomonadota bacterium]|nr:glycine--tRNA ligase subunit beta [Pseudomonadota bacterium]